MPKIRASKFNFHPDILKPEYFKDTTTVSPTNTDPDTQGASADSRAGTTAANGKPIWSLDQIAAHLNRTGASWTGNNDPAPQRGNGDPTVLTYGFFENQDELFDNGYVYFTPQGGFGLAEYFNFASFTEAQRAAAREAIQSWDDVAAISFQETTAGNADINFGDLANAPQTQAYARLPFGTLTFDPSINAQIQPIAGDVWISASQASNFQLDEGGYGLQTLTHEIGHSLGLSHPGAYNAAPGLSITYANDAEYYQDSRAYTVMSYFNASNTGGRNFDFNVSTTVYSGVPLVHDIAAIQAIYGADMTTRTGDTVYGFNSNAGRDSFDFDLTPAPVAAIWDAGGIDTIDASGYDTNQIIDLHAGSLSSIGGVTIDSAPTFAETNANRAAAGFPPISREIYDSNIAFLAANPPAGALTDNIAIAYGVTIENAIGGSGHDLLLGNEVTNHLTGNAGDDTFLGGDGVDYYTGGAGSDVFMAELNDTLTASKIGNISVDVVTDFKSGTDIIDLFGVDANANKAGFQNFDLVDKSHGKAGELFTISYASAYDVERALGINLEGVNRRTRGGATTVVFGDVDGGGADFAFVLTGAKAVDSHDLSSLTLGGLQVGQISLEDYFRVVKAYEDATGGHGTPGNALFHGNNLVDQLVAYSTDGASTSHAMGPISQDAFAGFDRGAMLGSDVHAMVGNLHNAYSDNLVIA